MYRCTADHIIVMVEKPNVVETVLMPAFIDGKIYTMATTANGLERRTLHFDTIDDILTDVERLAAGEHTTVGNWTFAQILEHLTGTINCSFDGFSFKAPWPLRFLAGNFMKKGFLSKPMKSGYKLPKTGGRLIPQEDGGKLEAALADFRAAIDRLKNNEPTQDNPVFGPMSPEDWDKLHKRHSELHLSFVRPVES